MSNQNSLDAETNDAAYSIVPILNNRLMTAASDAGWPKDAIEALSVDYDGETVYVRVSPDYQDKVDDLEYGTPFGLPNPVIGPFISRSDNIIKEILLNKTANEMTALLSEVLLG